MWLLHSFLSRHAAELDPVRTGDGDEHFSRTRSLGRLRDRGWSRDARDGTADSIRLEPVGSRGSTDVPGSPPIVVEMHAAHACTDSPGCGRSGHAPRSGAGTVGVGTIENGCIDPGTVVTSRIRGSTARPASHWPLPRRVAEHPPTAQLPGMRAYLKRTTVKLPDDLDARLRHEAERRGSTVSELTREAQSRLTSAADRVDGSSSPPPRAGAVRTTSQSASRRSSATRSPDNPPCRCRPGLRLRRRRRRPPRRVP